MRKIAVIVAMLAVLVISAGCGGADIEIEGEKEARKVYTYPSDNMFGLEKIVLFEDYAVAVFDAQKCDDGFVPLKDIYREKNYRFSVDLDNLSQYKIAEGDLVERKGKYVLTARATYDEANKRDSTLPVYASGLSFGYGTICCYEDRTYLQYMNTENSEYTECAYQEYYWDKGEWEEVSYDCYSEQPSLEEP